MKRIVDGHSAGSEPMEKDGEMSLSTNLQLLFKQPISDRKTFLRSTGVVRFRGGIAFLSIHCKLLINISVAKFTK